MKGDDLTRADWLALARLALILVGTLGAVASLPYVFYNQAKEWEADPRHYRDIESWLESGRITVAEARTIVGPDLILSIQEHSEIQDLVDQRTIEGVKERLSRKKGVEKIP